MVNKDKTTTVTESSQDHRDEECISYDTATTRETTTGDGSPGPALKWSGAIPATRIDPAERPRCHRDGSTRCRRAGSRGEDELTG
jgi:hypothetical protein